MVTVKVELPEPVTEMGLKLAAPVGSPVTLNVTVPVKPFNAVTVTVYPALVPWTTVWEAGVAEREKSGVGATFTISVTVVEWLRMPLVPVMVSV